MKSRTLTKSKSSNLTKGLFCLLLFFVFTLDLSAEKRFNDVGFTSSIPLVVEGGQGLSGHFAGYSNGRILVAGGCNFPDIPAAEGGVKKFYDDIYYQTLTNERVDGKTWKKIGKLPLPLAYGASVTVPEGVVCIGGTTDGKKSETAVYLLSSDGRVRNLPALPQGLDQMAAAISGGYIYVAGGQCDGVPSQAVFRLKYGVAKDWERLPDLPGTGRVQPVAVVQNGNVGQNLYLMGGYDPLSGKAQTRGAILNLQTLRWSETSEMIPFGEKETIALAGAAGVTSGAAHIVFFGGVNKHIFEQAIQRPRLLEKGNLSKEVHAYLQQEQEEYMTHPAEWYRFRNRLLIYHTITDTWFQNFQNPLLARAGAAVVSVKSQEGKPTWVVIDGESKPGIRSTDVTEVQMTYTARFGWLNWAVLIIYMAGMLFLGYYFMRRESSSDDFFKGGGRIPWWAAGISIFATMLSAITYMSIPAKAYATDWTYYPMQILILVVSFPVIKYYLPFFRRLNVTTAYEYLEQRFSYATRLLASVLFIVFMVARMALVLFLPSLAMTTVTGIDIYICIILMAVITIVYCTMGGMEAVVWGDVVQGVILVGGAFLAASYLIINTGDGPSSFFQIAMENDKFRLFNWSFDYRSATFWVVILGGLANNLISYTSDQTVIQRYLTTKDEKSAARSILTNGMMSVFVTIAFFTIGTGLYTFFKTHPMELDVTMAKSDAIFPFFMMSQLPAGIAGLLIAAVFAATMSTISSNINSISTAFTVDIYKKVRPQSKDSQMLLTARITGVVSGVVGMLIALLMASVNIQSLLDYFNTILGLLSGGIGGLFLMGIFFPRIGSRAALIGFLCGTAVVFYMNFYTQVNFLLFGFVSMLVSVVVALGLSCIWKEEQQQKGLTWKTLQK